MVVFPSIKKIFTKKPKGEPPDIHDLLVKFESLVNSLKQMQLLIEAGRKEIEEIEMNLSKAQQYFDNGEISLQDLQYIKVRGEKQMQQMKDDLSKREKERDVVIKSLPRPVRKGLRRLGIQESGR